MKTLRIPVQQINETQAHSLFDLMDRYYSGMTFDHFIRDLKEKDEVILLLDESEKIVGFSTVQKMTIEVQGRNVLALFSGDTVLEKEFWGNGALGLAFGQYLMRTKMQNPFTPTYWFLISKGYKTYLLMTNNFPFHFPRYERETPKLILSLMDAFYQMRFPGSYEPETGWIRIPKENVALKVEVAKIDQQMLLRHPRIRFFAEKNPLWQQGVELACVARVDIIIPLRYALKRLKKIFNSK